MVKARYVDSVSLFDETGHVGSIRSFINGHRSPYELLCLLYDLLVVVYGKPGLYVINCVAFFDLLVDELSVFIVFRLVYDGDCRTSYDCLVFSEYYISLSHFAEDITLYSFFSVIKLNRAAI